MSDVRNDDGENNFNEIVSCLEGSIRMTPRDASLYQVSLLKESFGSPFFTVSLLEDESAASKAPEGQVAIELKINLGIVSSPTQKFVDSGAALQLKWTELQRIYFIHIILNGLKELTDYLVDKHEQFCPGEDEVEVLMEELQTLISEQEEGK